MEHKLANENVFLMLTIGNASYAIPASDVDNILLLRRSAISIVPFDTSSRIRGIFNHRGTVIPILRCAHLLASSDLSGSDNLTAVILKTGNKRFAILTDKADSVTDRKEKDKDKAICLDVQKLYNGEDLWI